MDKPCLPCILTIIFVALLSVLTYVLWGLFSFKGRSEIWDFEIQWFFLLHKYAIV